MDDIKLMTHYNKGTPKDAKLLYEKILNVANQFLHNAKVFDISILQDEDPSYEKLASIMRILAQAVGELSDHIDPMLGTKALDYADSMRKMALAIKANDDVALKAEVDELDKRPFI